MLLISDALPSIPDLPLNDWLTLALGPSLAEYSLPNCSAGLKGALIPIKRTGFLPDCIPLKFITPIFSSHQAAPNVLGITDPTIKYGGFTKSILYHS